jgi:Undecaprenyl-diphosphatase (EC 3.6.1.27)
MSIFQSVILGLIQGFGEFLPISSSGHLLLARIFLGIQTESPALKMLDILLHIGTLTPRPHHFPERLGGNDSTSGSQPHTASSCCGVGSDAGRLSAGQKVFPGVNGFAVLTTDGSSAPPF